MKILILKVLTKNKIFSIQYIVYKILLNFIKNKWKIYNNNKLWYNKFGDNKI